MDTGLTNDLSVMKFAREKEVVERGVKIPVSRGRVHLEGDLAIPKGAKGVVVFAHGSGSSRHSTRNRFVAKTLREAGLATLLFDLLTGQEEREDALTGDLRFNIPLLAERLNEAAAWIDREPELEQLRIGYFGSSTGGAAALVAAAEHPERVGAVVSRGGRPDLAKERLPEVKAPVLLIVGGRDYEVLRLNEEALEALNCVKELRVVPGATHLFEEEGALEEVARLAGRWFAKHLGSGS